MRTYFTIFIALLSLHSIICQYNISGYVLESNSKAPIPYVNIGSITSGNGTVSNAKGYFEMTCESENEKIIFSSIGYEVYEVSADTIAGSDILLQPIDYKIQEVKITNTAFDTEVTLGARNEKGRGKSVSFGNPQLGTELGALIAVSKETYIKSANFVLNHAKGDSLLLRINIRHYENGTIGENVLTENVLVEDKQRKGTYTVDLTPYDIVLDSDVLLSVEWLRNFDDMGNEHVSFDTKKVRRPKHMRGVYVKNSSVSSFIKLPVIGKLKPCMYFEGKQSSRE